MTTQLKPEPLWQRAKRPKFRKVTKSQNFDVVIIGGGITGVTAAYLLKKSGKQVCLLERHRLGYVDTGLTTAHLTYVTDQRISDLAARFGDEGAALTWQAGAYAIDQIESIIKELSIDCDFHRVPGYLHEALHGQKDERESLAKDAEVARRLGFEAEFLDHVPYFNRPGVRFANQAKFHPLKYLGALAAAIHGDGSAIYEQAEVEETLENPQRVVVGKHEIECDHLVIATHVPLMGKTGFVNATLFQTKLYPYSSYVIGAKLPKNTVPIASFWDTSDPYYYLRVESGERNDYAIFGGNDHKTGQDDDAAKRFEDLIATLQTILPQAKPDRQWSGQVIETNDGLPYIGETAEKQFVATGYSGNGMTFGTIGAIMARDAVVQRENPWKHLFSVDRKKLYGGTWDYLSENIDYPYYLIKDRISHPQRATLEDVAIGDGKVISLDGTNVACSRDEEGHLHAVSAVCTHMGCLVHWNNAEQTWDCPCHGSRFKPTGEVLGGPAESPLEPHQPGAEKRDEDAVAARLSRAKDQEKEPGYFE
jgi:glycine/D-amino acid oxidase-like deaminating enzyme/nitrite reductase/ring-hydroxylating ferredoxin subunit